MDYYGRSAEICYYVAVMGITGIYLCAQFT